MTLLTLKLAKTIKITIQLLYQNIATFDVVCL